MRIQRPGGLVARPAVIEEEEEEEEFVAEGKYVPSGPSAARGADVDE